MNARLAFPGLLLAAALLLPATVQADTVVIKTGTILGFFVEDGDLGGISENYWAFFGEDDLEGVDGAAVPLPPGSNGKTITVRIEPTTTAPVVDMDWFFYNADRRYMDIACATGAAEESCTVPSGAATAYLDAFLGGDVDYRVELG
jgi:hypothetical protein